MSAGQSDNPATRSAEDFADALIDLGFSQYEARAYIGLLASEPRTGYAVAKATGVPQPKVYEALRKLVARGAAFNLAGEPARFVAVPPAELLSKLEAGFGDRLRLARESAAELTEGRESPRFEPVSRLDDWTSLESAALAGVGKAERRIYLSARDRELAGMRPSIGAARERGVDIVVLSFGKPFEMAGVRSFTHASTDRILYRQHQARHLALVVDSVETVWGLATDGRNWSGVVTDSPLIVAAIKDFIRHDIDFQRVYGDFADELREAYGSGLEMLEDYRYEPKGAAKDSDGRASEANASKAAG